MLASHDLIEGLELPNTLTPSRTHTTLVIGNFLRKLYSDSLAEDLPQRLQTLIARLEAAGRETRPDLR
ncbi:NepR family anti-sigma factor [Microvirga aerophila]|nr:NepR family anti-sigma factor [Microvirga aerophila]